MGSIIIIFFTEVVVMLVPTLFCISLFFLVRRMVKLFLNIKVGNALRGNEKEKKGSKRGNGSNIYLRIRSSFPWSGPLWLEEEFILIQISSNANRIGEATGDPGKSFLFFLMANCPTKKSWWSSRTARISGGWTVEPDYLAKRPYCQNWALWISECPWYPSWP